MGGSPPDFVDARDRVVAELVRFTRRLERRGVSVPANAAVACAEALSIVGLSQHDRVATALRAVLLTSPADREAFDELFPAFWYALRTSLEAAVTADPAEAGMADQAVDPDRRMASGLSITAVEMADIGPASAAAEDGATGRRIHDPNETPSDAPAGATREDHAGTASAGGGAHPIDVGAEAGTEPLEPVDLDRFIDALATVQGRRWRQAQMGPRVDFRRTFRHAVTAGGAPIELATRDRRPGALRTCVFVDVSESVLDAIDRPFLLRVLAELVDRGRRVRVFFFDTSIREVTDAFRGVSGSPAEALAGAEVDWGGGTEIGRSLRRFRKRWPDAVDRRTTTIIVSDGLEAGAVDTLEREMAWLSRRSGSVLWMNPLAASTAYSPACRGMAASLPFVDGLFAFGRSADLAEAARQLERHGPRGPIGYHYDFRDRDPTLAREVVGP